MPTKQKEAKISHLIFRNKLKTDFIFILFFKNLLHHFLSLCYVYSVFFFIVYCVFLLRLLAKNYIVYS